jgi:uncharacterized protein (DUF608 family)
MDSSWRKVSVHLDFNSFSLFLIFSAYCGGLHIASLRACIVMARIMDDNDSAEEYDVWLQLAKKSYSDKLWNG